MSNTRVVVVTGASKSAVEGNIESLASYVGLAFDLPIIKKYMGARDFTQLKTMGDPNGKLLQAKVVNDMLGERA